MVNYTERLSLLMQDIVSRVKALSFIDMTEVLVFGRYGRSEAEGAFATCHCLNLPTSEPGYYYWRDRLSGRLTRRSEWFVTKSPEVWVGPRRVQYLLSFVIPRFCDQTLQRSRKEAFYPKGESWVAKLDTVVHELYHIDPSQPGIRRVERADGTYSPRTHGPGFYENVVRMVEEYLASRPDPAAYDFLKHDFAELTNRYNGVVGKTFRNFPSFPQRYMEPLETQPTEPLVKIVPLKAWTQPTRFTEDDLHVRQFLAHTSRRLLRKGEGRAA